MATLSKRLSAITPSATMGLTMLVNKMRSEGRDVIGLVGGEPDYDTAEPVKEAGIAAIRANITRYPPGDGFAELREAASMRFRIDSGLDIPADQVLVSSGTKPLINAALLALTDPGDEVIVPVPYWVSYPQIARLAGLNPVLVPCPASNGFRLTAHDLAAAITPRTRILLLNSPNNPTGAVYGESDLRALLQVIERNPTVWVITDEIYDTILYTKERAPSFAALDRAVGARTITINGFSKGYAMAGWRLGYAGGAKSAVDAMAGVIGHIVGPTSSISQLAGAAALTGDQSYLATHNEEYRERRDIAVEAINAMPGLLCQEPGGAFFVWGDCSGVLGKRTASGTVIHTDEDFVAAVVEHAGVMFMPGKPFGMSPYFRISYSVAPDILRTAMSRLGSFVGTLK